MARDRRPHATPHACSHYLTHTQGARLHGPIARALLGVVQVCLQAFCDGTPLPAAAAAG